MQIFDYIVVGQGISGSVLGLELRKSGHKVLQFDIPRANSASRVAAGIWHPLVFKRLTKTWKADEFISAAEKFYANAEQEVNGQFFFPSTYYRVLNDIESINNWDLRASEERMKSFMLASTNQYNSAIQALEVGPVKHAGYLDTEVFLNSVAKAFKESLIREHFDANRVESDEMGISYKLDSGEKVRASRLVFADGVQALNNKYFNWIPFQPVKGEVLTIYSAALKADSIYSKGIFICPIGNQLYNVGATYNWRELDEIPSEKGRKELEDKLSEVIQVGYEVVSHKAGIRPAVRGRRPLIGHHPKNKRIWVFNGMGSKAVLMTPFLAKHIVDHWVSGNPIDSEINLSRFYTYYNKVDEQD